MNFILIAVLVLGAIALIAALVLFGVSKKFAVEEDPRLGQVGEILPGANCGGCGFAGCSGMAAALVKGADAGSIDGLIHRPVRAGKVPLIAAGGHHKGVRQMQRTGISARFLRVLNGYLPGLSVGGNAMDIHISPQTGKAARNAAGGKQGQTADDAGAPQRRVCPALPEGLSLEEQCRGREEEHNGQKAPDCLEGKGPDFVHAHTLGNKGRAPNDRSAQKGENARKLFFHTITRD